MTPTLTGRLQSRLFLNLVVTFPVLLLFNFVEAILVIFPVSLLFEMLYDYLQHKRWDSDWPLVFVFISAIAEGIIYYFIITKLSSVELHTFILMHFLIWSVSFVMLAGLLNILFPSRRFKSGKIL